MAITTGKRNTGIAGAIAADVKPPNKHQPWQVDEGKVAYAPYGTAEAVHDPTTTPPTVVIVGRFRSGKSTVLNAWVGLAGTDRGL